MRIVLAYVSVFQSHGQQIRVTTDQIKLNRVSVRQSGCKLKAARVHKLSGAVPKAKCGTC